MHQDSLYFLENGGGGIPRALVSLSPAASFVSLPGVSGTSVSPMSSSSIPPSCTGSFRSSTTGVLAEGSADPLAGAKSSVADLTAGAPLSAVAVGATGCSGPPAAEATAALENSSFAEGLSPDWPDGRAKVEVADGTAPVEASPVSLFESLRANAPGDPLITGGLANMVLADSLGGVLPPGLAKRALASGELLLGLAKVAEALPVDDALGKVEEGVGTAGAALFTPPLFGVLPIMTGGRGNDDVPVVAARDF